MTSSRSISTVLRVQLIGVTPITAGAMWIKSRYAGIFFLTLNAHLNSFPPLSQLSVLSIIEILIPTRATTMLTISQILWQRLSRATLALQLLLAITEIVFASLQVYTGDM